MNGNFYARLPLENADNVRDLGGLPTKNGSVTKWNRFFRSDGLSKLTEPDINNLFSCGIRASVDLRSDSERAERPSALKNANGIKYFEAPLFGQTELDEYTYNDYKTTGLGRIYAKNIETCGANIKNVFEIFAAEIKNGAIIYNCSAGKDRTGIISALLLDLAGVYETDIIANYEVTHTYIAKQIKHVQTIEPDLPDEVFYSCAENMAYFLSYLQKTYGGAKKYLLEAGVKESALENILENFIHL